MPNRQDIAGQQFGRLTANRIVGRNNRYQTLWECSCSCGNKVIVYLGHLRNGHTKSCGCLKHENVWNIGAGSQHFKNHPDYRLWVELRQRCNNPNIDAYKWYGARGISVCKRWSSFDNFLADMGNRPAGMSLDRIDVNGNYEPSNCRWATRSEQANNRRDCRYITYKGKTQTIAQWARQVGISHSSMDKRIRKWGAPIKEVTA